jgi:hypothetical protein
VAPVYALYSRWLGPATGLLLDLAATKPGD